MEVLGEACQGNQSIFVIQVPDRDILGMGSPVDSVYFKAERRWDIRMKRNQKGLIFTSDEGTFGRKLVVRVSFEQNVCWKSRHCFWMKKYSYFFSHDGTQSIDSIFYWKKFCPQAFWITSKHSVSCFSHSISSPDGSGLFALFALYFNSTYSYDVANVANENICRM